MIRKTAQAMSLTLLLSGLMLAGSLLLLLGASPTTPTQAAMAVAGDVVINEVAWMGTSASTSDEWIELYNTTAQTITLSGWTLSAPDGSPNITLNGVIPPYGYFLLERTDDNTISDILADWKGSFGSGGLNNAGESLSLKDSTNTVIDTANINNGPWPAGTPAPQFAAMERLNPYQPDTDDNWASNTTLIRNGLDANGNPVNGTPKARNSVSYPDLVAAKRGPAYVTAGAVITYQLTVTNFGPVPATGVRLTDTLPVELLFLSSSSPATQVAQSLVWTLDALAPWTAHSITLTGRVTDVVGQPFTNTFTVGADDELRTDNNAAAWSVSFHAPDLAATKLGPASVGAGDIITYYLTTTNLGLLPATGVRLTDTLPAAVTFLSSAPAPAAQIGQALVWTLDALAPGAVQWITLTGRVSITTAAPFTNTFSVSTIEEHFTNNNTVAWRTNVALTENVLINSLYYDGFQANDSDEAVELVNLGWQTVNLTGWELCKYGTTTWTCYAIPPMSIPGRGHVWFARNFTAFQRAFGFAADAVLSSWPGFTNDGDEVALRTQSGEWADALVYKTGATSIAGWSGDALLPYEVGLTQESQILSRIPDEATGLPITDTNTAADWLSYAGDAVYGRRGLYPGWDFIHTPDTALFWPLKATETATVVVGIAPDNAFEVVSKTLQRAQTSIAIEIYTLRHPALINLLIAKAQAGVSVTVLLEGAPAGTAEGSVEWQQELNACQLLHAAGGVCYFMISNATDDVYNRYNYIHAKLAVVDSAWALISSQNFTNDGLPADDKSNGTLGSRGVVIATDAPAVVTRAMQIFAQDCAPAHHADIFRWTPAPPAGYERYGLPTLAYNPTIPDGITYTVHFSRPLALQSNFGFELFTAPEASLRQSDALLGLINRAGAGDQVYVEQMYEHAAWGAGDNPRLEAYIAAARRGASVRILLNNGTFGQEYIGDVYQATLAYVKQIAAAERLNLRVAAGDPTGYGIHNKMVLVWLHEEGGFAHIGSINGSENSSKGNRELALQIHSDEVFEYLERVFIADWSLSTPLYLPLIARNYQIPQRLLISEVFYNVERDGEWVEIYNPTSAAIDLSQYKVGDTERPDSFEGMYRFPAGASIAPGQIIVVAFNGLNLPGGNYTAYEMYDFSPTVPNMERYPGWGDPRYDWGLRNAGDQVILLGSDDQPVDVMVWGDATYAGVIPHPGVSVWSNSLQRFPPTADTEDCSQDFREFAPTAGTVLTQ